MEWLGGVSVSEGWMRLGPAITLLIYKCANPNVIGCDMA